jgi:hypothetical protein
LQAQMLQIIKHRWPWDFNRIVQLQINLQGYTSNEGNFQIEWEVHKADSYWNCACIFHKDAPY